MATVSPGATVNDTSSRVGPPRSNVKLTPSNSTTPRTAAGAAAPGASTTSTGASAISCTRASETLAAARLAYSPISPCTGASSRVW